MSEIQSSNVSLSDLESLMRKEFCDQRGLTPTPEEAEDDKESGSRDQDGLISRNLEEIMRREFFSDIPPQAYIYRLFSNENSIRLFVLDPGPSDAAISGNLIHVFIPNRPPYEALSYCWGSSSKPCKIMTDEGTISITSSLHAALLCLRLPDASRTLWIDAVCIDQSSNSEKSSQILLMPSIYSLATLVIVYLGPFSHSSSTVPAFLDRIAAVDFGPNQPENVARISLSERGLPAAGDPAWIPYRAFWRRPWFHRMWIIQEFVLARDVLLVCGEWELGWMRMFDAVIKTFYVNLLLKSDPYRQDEEELELAIHGLENFYGLLIMRMRGDEASAGVLHEMMGRMITGSNVPSFGEIQRSRSTNYIGAIQQPRTENLGDSDASLMSMIHRTRSTEATDPRDRFFALLSLPRDLTSSDIELLRPNYDEDLKATICRYASVLINKGHCMDILYRSRIAETPPGLPSTFGYWATQKRKTEWAGTFGTSKLEPYRAAGDTNTKVRVGGEKGDELIISGCVLDTITGLVSGAVVQPGAVVLYPLIANSVLAEVDRLFDALSSYPTGEDLEVVKWRTLIANKASSSWPLPAPATMGVQYKACRERIKDMIMTPIPREKIPYFQSLAMLQAYKLCVTGGGYVGLVPLSAREGDHLAVLNGGNVPFVLRPRKKMDGFRVVGGCYIHGWMNGEVWGFEDWKEAEIVLH
jgi:hypothetical protein